jgi:phosphatidate cytidylyltransferase
VLKLRVFTVAVLLPAVAAAAFWLPGPWWSAFLMVAILIGGTEWSRLAGFGRARAAVFSLLIAACCATLWWSSLRQQTTWVYAASIVFWCTAVPYALWRKPAQTALRSTLTGIVVLVPTWLALVELQVRPAMMFALLAVVWISDSAAYGAGHAWGRHKLAPTVSPGKTWEGVAGAFAAVAVYAAVFHFWWFPATDFAFVLLSFFAITTLGILGDLYESLLKRKAGVKDSGTLLPGHGGMLDRIDALTAAMPLAALLFAQT